MLRGAKNLGTNTEETSRRFYTTPHPFYCGIDLHARTMYVCMLNQAGEILVYRNMTATPEALLKTISPYRDQIVLAAAWMFPWYWLADCCAEHGLPFVLGHALYRKAIRGRFPTCSNSQTACELDTFLQGKGRGVGALNAQLDSHGMPLILNA